MTKNIFYGNLKIQLTLLTQISIIMKPKILIFASIISLLACGSLVAHAKPYYKEVQESRDLEHYKWSHNFYCSAGVFNDLFYAKRGEFIFPFNFGASVAVGYKGRYDRFELEGRFAKSILEGYYGNINARFMFDCPVSSRCSLCSGLLVGVNINQMVSPWGINAGIPFKFCVHLTEWLALNVNADYMLVNFGTSQLTLGTCLLVKF